MRKRPAKKPAKKPKPKPKKSIGRMKAYITRQKERGLVNVCIWVPADYTYRVRKMADDLRREAGIENPRSIALYGDDDDHD